MDGISSENYKDFENTVHIIDTNKKEVVFQPLTNSDKTYDGNPYVHGEIIAKDTDWKNSDIAEIQKEVEQLYKEEKAVQKSAQEQADYTAELEEISSRHQTIDVLLSCGNLMPDEEERLSELRKEITAKGAVLDQLSQKSSKAFCPFCLGRTKNPHLYLNTEKNRFFCQRCGEHGNSVSLYAKIRGISNKESCELS